MGEQWLNEVLGILRSAGVRAVELFPARDRVALSTPAAAVGIRNLDWEQGTAEFEIRILSPRTLGGWACGSEAVKAALALEAFGVRCEMERLEWDAEMDCFCQVVYGRMQVEERIVPEPEPEPEPERFLNVMVGNVVLDGVTECSAWQNRERRMIGTLNRGEPVGVTPGTGGWRIRVSQKLPAGTAGPEMPGEPFTVTLTEDALVTTFTGCCWDKITKEARGEVTRLSWEGLALAREEVPNGEAEV